MTEFIRERSFADFMDRTRKGETADWLVVAIALMLPWSTTAVAILVPLWLIALLASLDVASVRRELMTPAGGLPVLLWALAAAGMLWADVEWSERIQGLRGYHKLLAIPLLLAQFRRSDRAMWVIYAFLFSSLVLLTLSWLTPYRGFLGRPKAEYGVPFKDYISQSGIFAICAFGLLGQAAEWWRMQRGRLTAAALIVAAIFVANIVFMATARSTLLIMAVLLLLFGFLQFRWKGVLAVVMLAVALASVSWVASSYLRERVTDLVEETAGLSCQRRRDVGRVAARVLEKVGRLRHRRAAHRPWNGNDRGVVPARQRRRAWRGRGGHRQPSQPGSRDRDPARPRRHRRADRDVDRASRIVSRAHVDRLVRVDHRGRQRRVVVCSTPISSTPARAGSMSSASACSAAPCSEEKRTHM